MPAEAAEMDCGADGAWRSVCLAQQASARWHLLCLAQVLGPWVRLRATHTARAHGTHNAAAVHKACARHWVHDSWAAWTMHPPSPSACLSSARAGSQVFRRVVAVRNGVRQ